MAERAALPPHTCPGGWMGGGGEGSPGWKGGSSGVDGGWEALDCHVVVDQNQHRLGGIEQQFARIGVDGMLAWAAGEQAEPWCHCILASCSPRPTICCWKALQGSVLGAVVPRMCCLPPPSSDCSLPPFPLAGFPPGTPGQYQLVRSAGLLQQRLAKLRHQLSDDSLQQVGGTPCGDGAERGEVMRKWSACTVWGGAPYVLPAPGHLEHWGHRHDVSLQGLVLAAVLSLRGPAGLSTPIFRRITILTACNPLHCSPPAPPPSLPPPPHTHTPSLPPAAGVPPAAGGVEGAGVCGPRGRHRGPQGAGRL
jgi:hypothetical protein